MFGPKDFYGEQKHLCEKCINGMTAVYDVSELANANHNMDKLYVAIEIAKRI